MYAVTHDTFPNPNSLTLNTSFNASSYQQYLASRTGPYTVAHGNSAAWLPLEVLTPSNASALVDSLHKQDSRLYLPESYKNPRLLAGFRAQKRILARQISKGSVAVYEFPFNGGGSAPNALQKPLSRGTVYLNASNPTGQPVISYNTFQNPFDAAVLYVSVNYTRSVFSTSALSALQPVELIPGSPAQSQEDIMSALSAAGSLQPSFAHPSCSCPMMPLDLGGCVAPDLRVYGVEKLSIVDASVMPIIPATHLQATMYAIAEKAADLIKARA
jgi:choline dehydrogenase-like flavoprotein